MCMYVCISAGKINKEKKKKHGWEITSRELWLLVHLLDGRPDDARERRYIALRG